MPVHPVDKQLRNDVFGLCHKKEGTSVRTARQFRYGKCLLALRQVDVSGSLARACDNQIRKSVDVNLIFSAADFNTIQVSLLQLSGDSSHDLFMDILHYV